MTDSCAVRTVNPAELAGPTPDLASPAVLDLTACDRLEFVVGLFEHEKVSLRYETWPQKMRNDLAAMIAKWQTANPARELRAITSAVVDRACVLIVHHSEKG